MCMYGMLIIRIKTFGFVPTNDKQQRQSQPQNHTNDSAGNDERQTTRRQSQPQNHTNDSAGNDDRQTTDRQTNELYVCMYFQL